MVITEQLDPIEVLNRDLRTAARTLSDKEARFLVDYYYITQDDRKRANLQRKALEESGEPHAVILWAFEQLFTLEKNVLKALMHYAATHQVGQWSQSIVGIGPVISAGLLAHIDMENTPSCSALWSFAGLDPEIKWYGSSAARELIRAAYEAEPTEPFAITWLAKATNRRVTDIYRASAGIEWSDGEIRNRLSELSSPMWRTAFSQVEKEYAIHADNAVNHTCDELGLYPAEIWSELYTGVKCNRQALAGFLSKRPWNASLKTLCWKIGESFVKTCNHKNSFYGPVYMDAKEAETVKNKSGEFVDQSAAVLKAKNIGKDTEAYKWYSEGKLPPAHMHARAKRKAVKLFLGHWWEVAYETHFGRKPDNRPYVFDIMGHQQYIPPPNWG